jgi:CRP-like cAMP-binding protein
LSYVRLYGVPTEGGILLRVKLSHDDLANGLGAAKKSVTRAFSDWQSDKLVEKRGTHYVVLDVDGLAARAPAGMVGLDWVAGSRLAG